MPVHVTTFKLSMSATSRGATPRFINSPSQRGLMPNFVTLCLAIRRTRILKSDWNGDPSYNSAWPPRIMCPILDMYMIQPVVVYCSATSSGVMRRWRTPSFFPFISSGPTACTMALGVPVVPEE